MSFLYKPKVVNATESPSVGIAAILVSSRLSIFFLKSENEK